MRKSKLAYEFMRDSCKKSIKNGEGINFRANSTQYFFKISVQMSNFAEFMRIISARYHF